MNNELEQLTREIYQFYYREKIYNKVGSYPRALKNWDKAKEKPEWPYIERFASIVNRSAGQIDYKIFIKALFDFSNGQYFSPKLFVSPKGIAIYNAFVKTVNDESNPDKVKEGIIRSIKYMVKFCIKNNLRSFSEYFYKNANVYPSIILHYNAGSISKAFFTLIPNIEMKLKNFPEDIIADYFSAEKIKAFKTDKILYASLSPTLEKIALNYEDIMNHYIDKGWKKFEEKE
jgi:hypothetical protein